MVDGQLSVRACAGPRSRGLQRRAASLAPHSAAPHGSRGNCSSTAFSVSQFCPPSVASRSSAALLLPCPAASSGRQPMPVQEVDDYVHLSLSNDIASALLRNDFTYSRIATGERQNHQRCAKGPIKEAEWGNFPPESCRMSWLHRGLPLELLDFGTRSCFSWGTEYKR